MLLKIIGVILVVIIAMTAHAPHQHHAEGVTITATCPNEDDLWEHVERCTVDVQPNR